MKKKFNKKNICVYSLGRLQSTRCKNKMKKNLYNGSLTKIIIKKLSKLDSFNTFFAGYENYFENICNKHSVRFIKRSRKSCLSEGPNKEIHSFLFSLDYDYFLLINPCLPFLKLNTIKKFIKFCISSQSACSILTRKNNYFFNKQLKPLNFKENIKTLNTKTVDGIYEFSNCMYFFNKNYLKNNNNYWSWNKIKYMIIDDELELFDIDTESDFQIAKSISLNMKYNFYS